MTSLIGGVKLQYKLRLLSLGCQVLQNQEDDRQSASNNKNQVKYNFRNNILHLQSFQVLLAYSRRAYKICRILFGTDNTMSQGWKQRLDRYDLLQKISV